MTATRFTREASTVESVESAITAASESLILARNISGALAEYIAHDLPWRSQN